MSRRGRQVRCSGFHSGPPQRSGVVSDYSLLRAREVARLLAVSVRSVWRLASTGLIPTPVKVGGATRWRARDIHAFVAERGEGGTRASRTPTGGKEQTDCSGFGPASTG